MKSVVMALAQTITLIVAVSACSPEVVRSAQNGYQLSVFDNVPERRFDLSLTSSHELPLCVSIDDWPNSTGHFTVENEDVFLQVGSERLAAGSSLMSVYCPVGCGKLRIEPHNVLRGFIVYEAFGDPMKLAAEADKQLQFKVHASVCKGK